MLRTICEAMLITGIIILPEHLAHTQSANPYDIRNVDQALLEGADAVVRHKEIRWDLTDPEEVVYYEKRVVTFLKENQELEYQSVWYNGLRTINFIRGEVYDAGGRLVREITKRDVNDRSYIPNSTIYQDTRVKYVKLGGNALPFTVAFEFEFRQKGLFLNPVWAIQEFGEAVVQASFTVIVPSAMEVSYKMFHLDNEPVVSESGGVKQLTWEVRSLPSVKEEPNCPPENAVLPNLVLAPHQSSLRNYTGSFENWEVWGKFMQQLLEDRDRLPADHANTLRELIRGLDSDSSIVEALYRYLQTTTRYVSVQVDIGGWQPFPASEVAEKKYGDCKGLSNYMMAMLKEAGIEAWPALIENGARPNVVPEEIVYPYFNHMILYVPSLDRWLECTSSDYPPGYIGYGNQHRNALLITDNGGVLKQTPVLGPSENTKSTSAHIVLAEDGSALWEVSVNSTGALHEIYRSMTYWLNKNERQEMFLEKSQLPAMLLDSLRIEPEPDAPAAHVVYSGKVLKLGARSGKRIFLPVNPVSAWQELPEEMPDRQLPLWWELGFNARDTLTFELPPDFVIESTPADTALETPYGSYSLLIQQKDRKVVVYRHFTLLPVRLPAPEYQSWRQFLIEVSKADRQKMVLREQKT